MAASKGLAALSTRYPAGQPVRLNDRLNGGYVVESVGLRRSRGFVACVWTALDGQACGAQILRDNRLAENDASTVDGRPLIVRQTAVAPQTSRKRNTLEHDHAG